MGNPKEWLDGALTKFGVAANKRFPKATKMATDVADTVASGMDKAANAIGVTAKEAVGATDLTPLADKVTDYFQGKKKKPTEVD
jgi:hypothetical protein